MRSKTVMPSTARPFRRSRIGLWRLWRVIRHRPRLFASTVIGMLISLLLPHALPSSTRLLIGWDAGVTLYLVLAYELMARSDVEQLRRRASAEDEGQFAILVLTVAAALASLAAIILELGSSAHAADRKHLSLALATLTIALSWAFIHTIFALHYAHEFYEQNGGKGGGLLFPGGGEPDYWDFVYFSFVIGMTSQVSDVGVTAREIRRTVAAHGIVSFFFNVALLALTINIAASAI
jgi:uncharacterized membrane protein